MTSTIPIPRPTYGRFLAATALSAVFLATAPQALAGQSAQQRIDTTFAFDRSGSVSLGLVSGEIRVTTGSPNEIRIVATTERGRLESTLTRSRVSIEARSVNGRMGATRYDVVVPPGVRVRASAVSGDVSVRGTGSEVTASTVSGEITVEEASGIVELSSVSGGIDARSVGGRVDIESVSGDIDVDDISGSLATESVSGEVTIRRGRLDALRAESVSGTITYSGALAAQGDLRINSHSGDVYLTVPADLSASLEMETWSGDIASDFPLTLQPGENVGRRNRRVRFTVGNGGARITAETFSGDITIRRAGARTNPE
ncbi:MAG: DUF4097 family beta strand repeat-containing protein [Gemmatimonadaceae bacterium]